MAVLNAGLLICKEIIQAVWNGLSIVTVLNLKFNQDVLNSFLAFFR